MPERKILEAHWETRERGVVMLSRDWHDAEHLPPLFINPGTGPQPLKLLRRVSPLLWGRRSGYCINGNELAFVLWPAYYGNLDWDDERIYVAGEFNGWGKAVGQPAWLMKREIHDGQGCLVLRVHKDTVFRGRPVQFKFVTELGRWQEVPISAPNRIINPDGCANLEVQHDRTGNHVFHFWPEEPHPIQRKETLLWKDHVVQESCSIAYGEMLLALKSDLPLGVYVEDGKTTFRLFAPRARKVQARVMPHPDHKDPMAVDLKLRDDTVWEATVNANLAGHFYFYSVDGENQDAFSHFDSKFRVLDPYAIAVLGRFGPGIIVDRKKIKLPEEQFTPPFWHDLVILEAHVRDLIAKAPVNLSDQDRRGFRGLAQWLRQEDCYLRRLGVNAVELQPIQEFDCERPDEYHWGYMTVNYFSPASAYSRDPFHASQIEDFQDLVSAFHEANLAVILDVVYNHVGEPAHLLFVDKYYYFQTDNAGKLSNWSGCGNDLRTDTPMGTRLIIDSLVHLVKTYDVDGFRFDLADLVGLAVLREIEIALKAVKPSIILIAEPWSFRGHIGHALRHTGFASWNDGFREFLFQYVLGHGNQDGLKYFVSGSPHYYASWPAQTINYTESHDDYCWLDRITENANHNGMHPTANDIRRTHLMLSLLMVSVGVPMLSAGQDFLRSKAGVHNTYKRGDLNALEYHRIAQFPGTNEYFRHWVRFRSSELGKVFRLHTRQGNGYIQFYGAHGCSSMAMIFNADRSNGQRRVVFAINPHFEETSIGVPGDLKPSTFVQLADQERFHMSGLDAAYSPWKEGRIYLAPMSCGLWVEKEQEPAAK